MKRKRKGASLQHFFFIEDKGLSEKLSQAKPKGAEEQQFFLKKAQL